MAAIPIGDLCSLVSAIPLTTEVVLLPSMAFPILLALISDKGSKYTHHTLMPLSTLQLEAMATRNSIADS